jgi:hypothetical protein
VGFLCIRSILYVFPSDLPGVNPATLNGMLLYYRLMTKWSGLGDSTELSRVGLSHYTGLGVGFRLCGTWRGSNYNPRCTTTRSSYNNHICIIDVANNIF